jgi:hypothetical protein
MGAKTFHLLSHTRFTFTTLPWKENELLLGRTLLVAEYQTNEILLTSKVDLDSYCEYRYFLVETTHAVLFRGVIFIITWNLIKIVSTVFEKIVILCFVAYLRAGMFRAT